MELPALRQHKEDILSLAEHFLGLFCVEAAGRQKHFRFRRRQCYGNIRGRETSVNCNMRLKELSFSPKTSGNCARRTSTFRRRRPL